MTSKKNLNKTIKVLNIAQPHAHNVIHSGKNIENRTMLTKVRGTIAIYASATYQKRRFENQKITREECNFGCIIGFVDVVDCITENEVSKNTKKWFHGPYGYVLENVRVLKNPIPVKPPRGAIVWWNLEGKDAEKCLKQININTVVPISEVNFSKPKPLTGRTKLLPTKELSLIVGDKPLTLNKALNKLSEYLEDNELIFEDEDQNLFFETDKKLRKIFKQKEVSAQDSVEILKNNLKAS